MSSRQVRFDFFLEDGLMRSVSMVALVVLVSLLSTNSIVVAGLSDGLVAYYPFDGNADDASGNGYDLTGYNGPAPATDRNGNPTGAYRFDGTNDHMAGASYDVVTPGAQGSFALSFWFSPTSTWTTDNNPNTMLVGNIVNDPPVYRPDGWFDWGVMIASGPNHDGSLYFWWIDDSRGNNRILNTTTATWNAGSWYHVLYNYDVSVETLSVWVGGSLEDTLTVTTDIGRNNGGNTLGIARYNAQHADMSIDELRIYDRALTAGEIAQLADTATIPAPSAIVLVTLGGVLVSNLRRRLGR